MSYPPEDYWEKFMNPPPPLYYNREDNKTDITFYIPANPKLMDFLTDEFQSLLHLVDEDLFHSESEDATVGNAEAPQANQTTVEQPKTIKLDKDVIQSINEFLADAKNKSKTKPEKSAEGKKSRKHYRKQSISRSPSPRRKASKIRSPSPSYRSSRIGRSPSPGPSRRGKTSKIRSPSPSYRSSRIGRSPSPYRERSRKHRRSQSSRSRSYSSDRSPHRPKSFNKRSRRGTNSRRSHSRSPRRSPSYRTSSRYLDEDRYSHRRRSRSPSPRRSPYRSSFRHTDEGYSRPGPSSRRSVSPSRSPRSKTTKSRGKKSSRRGTSSSHSTSPRRSLSRNSQAKSPSKVKEPRTRRKSPIKLGPTSFPIVDDYTKELAVEMNKRQLWDGEDIAAPEVDAGNSEEEGEILESSEVEKSPTKKSKKKKKSPLKKEADIETANITQDEPNPVEKESTIEEKEKEPEKSLPKEPSSKELAKPKEKSTQAKLIVKKESVKREGHVKREISDRKVVMADFYCALCQLTLNSEGTYEAHVTGKRHGKALRCQDVHEVTRGTLSAAPSTSFATEDTPRFGNPAQGKVFVSCPEIIPHLQPVLNTWNEGPLVGLEFVREIRTEYDDATYHCQICDAPCHGASIMPHLTGFKHQLRFLKEIDPHYYELHKDVPKKKFEGELRLILWRHEEKYGRCPVEVVREVDGRPSSSQPSTSGQSRRNESVKREGYEEDDDDESIKGNEYLDTSTGDFYCTLCDSHMNNVNMWNAHVIGKRHLKNLKKVPGEGISKLKAVPSPNTPSELEAMIEAEASGDLIVGLDCMQETQVRNGVKYTCHLCGSCCTNIDVIEHLRSMKHKKKYLEQMDADGKKNALSTIRHLDIQSDQFRTSLIDEQCYQMLETYGRGKVKVYVSKK